MSAPAALAEALKERYAIRRRLGAGGFATVYLADDVRHGRQVAVKVLDYLPDPDRFLEEIRITARLAHPHIVPLIDSGATGGVPWYVTPHITGGSLRDRLDQAPRLPLGEAVRIVREVAAALDFAHRQGFCHLDVKPENILFADGHAVLADFGIARAFVQTVPEDPERDPMMFGTPVYMSPEQVQGEAVGAASDTYSLATVAYEMLAGTTPFAGRGIEVAVRIVSADAPPLRAVRPDVPQRIERVIARGLARAPADRFATIGEMAAALEAEEAPGAPPWAARSIAVLPFVNASAEPDTEYLSDGITDELIDALAKVEGLRVASRTSVFALKGKPGDVRAIGALLDAAWIIEGTVRRAGTRLRITAQLTSATDGKLLWSERFDRTLEDVFAIQEEIARTIVDTLRATTFADLVTPAPGRRTTSVEAYNFYLMGRYAWNKRTQADVTASIGFFEQAVAADPGFAQGYAGLADAYALSLDYRNVPVAESFAKAETYARRAIALDETVAEAHASLAWSLFIYDWNWDESHAEFRRAIALDPSYATARQWHAFWLSAHARHDDALAEVHRAQELDPASVAIRRSVGWVYYYARRFDQARHHLERALAMNPTSDETYRVLGLTCTVEGRWAEAERALREAVALSGGGTYNHAALGYLFGRQGRRDEALEALAELERAAASDYVSPVAFATVHLGLGEADAALDWMDRALAERRGWLAYLRVHPIVDPVRGHPRFQHLLATLRL